jgi:hypothetical protein
MTRQAFEQALATYAAGLEAEMSLLERLDAISAAQRVASDAQNLPGVHEGTDERERLLAHLVALEADLRPVRQAIALNHRGAEDLPLFKSVAERHRTAADLVARILAADEVTLTALREAEIARRFAAQAIEAGENTLAAYRRVVAPPLASASLLNKRG